MEKIKIIIIDDETPARDLIRHYLSDLDSVEIIAECADGFSGLKSISTMKPDLVFLDIQMPRLTGIEMLEVLTEKPLIIFTTAYDQFAIKAFELNAVDYLMKPFTKRRFLEAVNKAIEKIRSDVQVLKPGNEILKKMPGPEAPVSRIVVRKANSINIIPLDQVKYVEAQNDYVMIWYTNGKALKQQTMKYYEDNLPASEFVRVHRSYIVNVLAIKRIEPYGKENHVAILNTGEKLPVSKSGYKKLKDDLGF
jgi:two-component system LytT family response regulator